VFLYNIKVLVKWSESIDYSIRNYTKIIKFEKMTFGTAYHNNNQYFTA